MNIEFINNWVDKYVKAWRNPENSALEGIFTEDISYRVSPWKEPIRNLKALGKFWEEANSKPGEKFDIKHQIVAIDGNKAVIEVEVEYYEENEQWRDLWIVDFSEEGLCRTFEEWPFKKGQEDGQKI